MLNDEMDLSNVTIKTIKNKRRYNRLTLENKIQIIKDYKTGLKNIELTKKYNVHHSTITKIIVNQEKLVKQMQTVKSQSGNGKTKKYTALHESPFEKAMYLWFIQKRSLGEPLTGILIRKTAKQFHSYFYGETEFLASEGWLKRFKNRHGVRALNIKPEESIADDESANVFQESLYTFALNHDYDLDNMYSADEFSLFWKALPSETLAAEFEREVAGKKIPKDRITVQACANATGTHKIPLMIIGKSAQYHCLGDLETLPVAYKSQKKGWMDRTIFLDWYTKVFLPNAKERKPGPDERFILVLDNAPSHPLSEQLNAIDPQCTVIFLQPNVTAQIQPMDQGVISSLKRRYKISFLRELLVHDLPDSDSVVQFTKKWPLRDCCFLLAGSWSTIEPSRLQNAWNKILNFDSTDPVEEEYIIEIPDLISRIPGCSRMGLKNVEEWIDQDQYFPAWQPLSFEEIVDICSGLEKKELEDDEDEEPEEPIKESNDEEEALPPIDLLLNAALQLCRWGRKDSGISAEDCFALNNVRDCLLDLKLRQKDEDQGLSPM